MAAGLKADAIDRALHFWNSDDLLDLLEAFPSARPPLSELLSALDPLLPRLYSIASSPKKTPGPTPADTAP